MKARVRRKLIRLVNHKQRCKTDGDRCDQILKGVRSRSASPRKRPADQMMRSWGLEEYEDYDNDECEMGLGLADARKGERANLIQSF